MKIIALFSLILLIVAPAANAVPDLQLFIDGATYDWGTQTWVTNNESFDLYVVSANGYYRDVIVSMALGHNDNPQTTAVNFNGQNINPDDWKYGSIMGDYHDLEWGGGDDLPQHGVFPTYYDEIHTGSYWYQQAVGDVQPDDQGNYWNPATGIGEAHQFGQVKAFHVETGGVFTSLHFDAYTRDWCGNITTFAPFSHDAGLSVVPEPGTILLLGSGLLGVNIFAFRRRKAKPKRS